MAEPMILRSLAGLDVDQRDFYNAASSGNKKILKKLLDTGKIHDVDLKNEEGQTPLFYACFEGEDESVRYLLEKGANPNEPTEHGQTPLHAACYQGCVKSVSALVERGGDFRLHDKEQRTGKDWAMLNPNSKKRQVMTEYIVKTRMFAMTHSGRDVLLERQSSAYMRKPSANAGSMAQLFKRIGSKHGKGEHLKISASLMSLGYGKVYGGEKGGTISTIPMIAESILKHDDYGTTFMNSAYFVMEGMMLGPTKVTVKRLHHDPPKGGVVDHLIRECENIAHLRHPNVLLLMATCATDNMEGMVLIFERVYFGSLYNYLHEKNQQPASHAIIEAGLQLCEGLIYIHQNNFIHNYISSHSVFLTNTNTLKIGNFEYLVPMTIGGKAARFPGVSNNRYLNAAYNWLSPELIKGDLSTEKSDIYGFCAVLWEMFTGFIPWAGHDAEQIEKQVCNQKMLKVNDPHVPSKLVDVLHYGLQPNTNNRKMNLEQIRDILSLMPRGRPKSEKTSSPAQQPNNNCSADLYETIGSTLDSPVSSRRSRSRRTQTRRRHTLRDGINHPTDQDLKCNHQTQTRNREIEPQTISPSNCFVMDSKNGTIRPLQGPPPLAPLRRKHLSVPKLKHDEGSQPASSLTSVTYIDTGSQSSLERYHLKQAKRNKKAQERIQLCIALKAPLHQELKMYCNQVKQEMADVEMKSQGDGSETRPQQILDDHQLTLQRELNKELHSVFSESLLFAHDDEGEENDNFASLNLDELSDDIETVLQRNKPGRYLGEVEEPPVFPLNAVEDNVSPSHEYGDKSLFTVYSREAPHYGTALYQSSKRGPSARSPPRTRSQSSSARTSSGNARQGTQDDQPTSRPPKSSISSSSLETRQRYMYNMAAIKPAGHCTIARPASVRSSGEGSLQHLMSGSSLPSIDRNQPAQLSRNGSQTSNHSSKIPAPYHRIQHQIPPTNSQNSSSISCELPCDDVRPKSYRGIGRIFERQPLVETTRSEGYQRYKPGWLQMDWNRPTGQQEVPHSEGNNGALRYLGRERGAITQQKPVVEIIKKLDKPFGKCQNSDRVRAWREAHQRREEAVQSSKPPAGKLALRMDTSIPNQNTSKPTSLTTVPKPLSLHKDGDVVQTPTARAVSCNLSDSTSTYGAKVSDRKRLFESNDDSRSAPSLSHGNGSIRLKSSRPRRGDTPTTPRDHTYSPGSSALRNIPSCVKAEPSSSGTNELMSAASARPILGRECRPRTSSNHSSPAQDQPDKALPKNVRSFVENLEKTSGYRSPGAARCSSQSKQNECQTTDFPTVEQPSEVTTTTASEDAKHETTEVSTLSLNRMISSFQLLADNHEKQQSEWKKYSPQKHSMKHSSPKRELISSSSTSSNLAAKPVCHPPQRPNVASTKPVSAEHSSRETEIPDRQEVHSTPRSTQIGPRLSPDLSPCSSGDVIEYGRDVSAHEHKSPPEISLTASHIIKAINGTAVGLSSPEDGVSTDPGNTPSNPAESSRSTRHETSSPMSSTKENDAFQHDALMHGVTPDIKHQGDKQAPGSDLPAEQERAPADDDCHIEVGNTCSSDVDVESLDRRISECEYLLTNDTTTEKLARQLQLSDTESSEEKLNKNLPTLPTPNSMAQSNSGSEQEKSDDNELDGKLTGMKRWSSQPSFEDQTSPRRWDSTESYSNEACDDDRYGIWEIYSDEEEDLEESADEEESPDFLVGSVIDALIEQIVSEGQEASNTQDGAVASPGVQKPPSDKSPECRIFTESEEPYIEEDKDIKEEEDDDWEKDDIEEEDDIEESDVGEEDVEDEEEDEDDLESVSLELEAQSEDVTEHSSSAGRDERFDMTERPYIIPGSYIGEEGDRATQLSPENLLSARYMTPMESPRGSESMSSFFRTPESSPTAAYRLRSVEKTPTSSINQDADTTVLVGEPSPLVDENNNPIEPEELTKTYHPVVTSEEFLHGAAASIVPPLDLTCLPVTEQSPECSDLGISGLNKPSHALDERHINTRCKLALSLHDKKTDALKQSMEVIFERDGANNTTPRTTAKAISGSISAVQEVTDIGEANFVGKGTSVKVAGAYFDSEDKTLSKHRIFFEIEQSKVSPEQSSDDLPPSDIPSCTTLSSESSHPTLSTCNLLDSEDALPVPPPSPLSPVVNELARALEGCEGVVELHQDDCLEEVADPQMRESFSTDQDNITTVQHEASTAHCTSKDELAVLDLYDAECRSSPNKIPTADVQQDMDQHETPSGLLLTDNSDMDGCPFEETQFSQTGDEKQSVPSDVHQDNHDVICHEAIAGQGKTTQEPCQTEEAVGVHKELLSSPSHVTDGESNDDKMEDVTEELSYPGNKIPDRPFDSNGKEGCPTFFGGSDEEIDIADDQGQTKGMRREILSDANVENNMYIEDEAEERMNTENDPLDEEVESITGLINPEIPIMGVLVTEGVGVESSQSRASEGTEYLELPATLHHDHSAVLEKE